MSKDAEFFYEFGRFRIDPAQRLLLRDGRVIPLTPKVFDTLLLLVESRGRLMEKDELMEALWPDTFVEEGNLMQNVSRLRKVLGDNSGEQYIETLPRRGYRFVAEVRQVKEEGADDGAELIVRKRTRAHISTPETKDDAADSAVTKDAALATVAAQPAGLNGHAAQAVASTQSLRPQPSASPFRFWKSKAVLAITVALAALLAAASYFWLTHRARQPQTPAEVKTIAVLPFKEMTDEPGDKYLGIGIADALITKFGNLHRIIVRPTSAVRKYADTKLDAVAVGRELGVEAVLEGNIQRTGERVRVTVQLLRISDGAPLWGESFDDSFTDIFAVQDSISAKVVAALTMKLSGEEEQRLQKRYTDNSAAYEAYLKGRYFWNKRTGEGFKKAIEFFKQATDIDPNYALAYAGMADSYGLTPAYTGAPPKDYFPQAKAAALKALELDEQLSEAHASLGWVYFTYEWNWPETEKEYRRAIELKPNYPTVHLWYSFYLQVVGRNPQSIEELKQAQQLDPLSLPIRSSIAVHYYYAHQYDEAMAECRKTLEIDPNYQPGHYNLARIYLQKGMLEEAVKEAQESIALGNGESISTANLTYIYAASGRRAEATKLLEKLAEPIRQEKVPPVALAAIYGALGDKDAAFAWLEKGFERRDINMPRIKDDPELNSLHQDPRLDDALRRMKLTP